MIMINNIKTGDLQNNPLIQQEEVSEVQKSLGGQKAYNTTDYLYDESDISDEAMKLYEMDQEIQKYKKAVMEDIEQEESIDPLVNLIKDGKYDIDNEDLAESLMEDSSFINSLF